MNLFRLLHLSFAVVDYVSVVETFTAIPINIAHFRRGGPLKAKASDLFETLSEVTLGEADRSFQLGLGFEKNGLPRKSAAAFHEAANLYQSFLDSHRASNKENTFDHVTTLDPES